MNAVALSGGGDKGAFTVGVLKRLYNKGERFDIIAGTSTGALIAPLAAIDEIDLLWSIYENVKKKDVLSEMKPVTELITGTSLYDVRPLEKMIRKTITDEMYLRVMNSGKKIFISTVCLQNQRLTYFTNSDLPGNKHYDVLRWKDREQFIMAIVASCIQPVIMPPVSISRLQYIDGGIRNFLPADVTIDAGAENITAILTLPDNERPFDADVLGNMKDILLRTIDIFSNEVFTNDIRITELYSKGASFVEELRERVKRNTGLTDDQIDVIFTSAGNPFFGKREIGLRIIRPQRNLGDGLSFSNMKEMLELGYDTPDSVTSFYA